MITTLCYIALTLLCGLSLAGLIIAYKNKEHDKMMLYFNQLILVLIISLLYAALVTNNIF